MSARPEQISRPGLAALTSIPSVDRVLTLSGVAALVLEYGREAVLSATRALLLSLREQLAQGKELPGDALSEPNLMHALHARLEADALPSLRAVFNLTGTVLHTNLGRAVLPEEAVVAVARAMSQPCNLEFDLGGGGRGDRDSLVDHLLCELTGAEAATVVNNNAAAVFLALNTLANRKEVIVSRGELVEIGGAFRVPDIMSRSGGRLHEVGTTNRTHARDYLDAIGPKTGLLLKVHASNYAVIGFTATVPEDEVAAIAHAHGLPFMIDLGSGTLVDLARYGLPHEPTPQEALANGADLVTFSGDKLLGGPQAGILVGKKELIARIKKNPLKRALRVDKMTYAALEAVLRLYRDPHRLAQRLPALRLLTRPAGEIEAMARRVLPAMETAWAGKAQVALKACASQIGSGSLPVDLQPSFALAVSPLVRGKGAGTALGKIEQAFRTLPVPVIGRVTDGAFCLDMRCLEDEAGFVAQLSRLSPT